MKTEDAFEFVDSTFDLEDSGDLVGLARSLINGQHPGVLATVDENGSPSMRWMSTLACEEFPVFHTLTAANARKVEEITLNPKVNWMFFNRDLSLVVSIKGKARIIHDPATLKKIWREVVDKTHTYFLNEYSHRPGFVAIETTAESVECISPSSGMKFQLLPSELTAGGDV